MKMNIRFYVHSSYIFLFAMCSNLLTRAQNDSIVIEPQEVESWFARNWIWVAVIAVVLIILLLMSGGRSTKKTTTFMKNDDGSSRSVTTTEDDI